MAKDFKRLRKVIPSNELSIGAWLIETGTLLSEIGPTVRLDTVAMAPWPIPFAVP
jgi:hypothetical protein